MKRFQHYLLSLLALTIGLASCSKDKEYQRVIPSDASFVVSVQLQDLIKKADFDSKANKNLREKLYSSLGSTDEEEKFYKETFDSPDKTGLDLSSPLYGFSAPEVKWAMVARVKDEGDVKTFLTKLHSFDEESKPEMASTSASAPTLLKHILSAMSQIPTFPRSSKTPRPTKSLPTSASALSTKRPSSPSTPMKEASLMPRSSSRSI